MTTSPKLRGVSDLREFFRTNQRPIYFVSPTAFNLLGIDRWVRDFRYVCQYDSFDGGHPNVFVPADRRAPEFESIEDICNYLLRHPEVRNLVRSRRIRRTCHVRHVRRRDRGAGRRDRAAGCASPGGAASPAGLQDRHDPARQRRGRAQRAECAGPGIELPRAAGTGGERRARLGSRRADCPTGTRARQRSLSPARTRGRKRRPRSQSRRRSSR